VSWVRAESDSLQHQSLLARGLEGDGVGAVRAGQRCVWGRNDAAFLSKLFRRGGSFFARLSQAWSVCLVVLSRGDALRVL
jgi:hypothetical protein